MKELQLNNSGDCSLNKYQSLLPTLAEAVLNEVEQYYEEEKQFTAQVYHKLHAIYPAILVKALDIVDRYEFIKFTLLSNRRCLYKIIFRSCQFTLYHNINFCTCSYFNEEVLKYQNALTCEHVLALKLARIIRIVKNETISNSQLSELLKSEMNNYLGFFGFSDEELTD